MGTPVRPEFDLPPPSPWLAYFRLMRLPNVFTAVADVAMGFLFVHPLSQLPRLWPTLVLLILASALLYTAGMVLNDLFDLEVDRRERPFRPLPAGHISVHVAQRMGFLFLFNGVMLAAGAGLLQQPNFASPWRSGVVAALLALSILAYNGALKKTFAGPLGMGLCRMLNVLLGMSTLGIDLAGNEQTFLGYHTSSWLVAGGLGLYIVGVTWFARSEAEESNSFHLVAGAVVLLGGIAVMACFVLVPHPGKPLLLPPQMVFLLFCLMALPLLRRLVLAISDPESINVQAAVKQCIMSIIVWATCVTLITTGPLPGLAIASLMIPAFLLGRWVYST